MSSANSCSKHPPNLPVTSPTSASASVKSSQNPLAGPASFAPQPCQYFLEVDQLQTRLFQSHRLYYSIYSYYTDSQPTQKNTYSCYSCHARAAICFSPGSLSVPVLQAFVAPCTPQPSRSSGGSEARPAWP